MPRAGKSVAKLLNSRTRVRDVAGSGHSQGSLRSATMLLRASRRRPDQPSPEVGLLRVPDARHGPAQCSFEELHGVFHIEPAGLGLPKGVEIRLSGTVPPHPELLRLATPLPAREPLDLNQDDGAPNDGRGFRTVAFDRLSGLGMQLRPRPYAHPAVAGILCAPLGGGFVPGPRVLRANLSPWRGSRPTGLGSLGSGSA